MKQAVADAVLAALIGFPLIWEATARFHFLDLLEAWTASAAIGSGFVIVSFRRRMPALLWPVIVGMPPLCLALSLATRALPPWLALVLVGALILQWTAMLRRRFRPPATTGLVLSSLCLALTTAMACVAPPLVLEHTLVPWQLLSIQIAAFVLGVAPLLVRAARHGRMHRRHIWVAAVATLLGLGGALAVGLRTGGSLAVGVAASVIGLAACVVALRIRQPAALGAPGLAVAVVGLASVLPGRWFPGGLGILAAGAALAAASRRDGPLGTWLGVQAAIVGGLVLSLSGALAFGIRALLGAPNAIPKGQVALALVSGLACAATLPARGDRARARSRELLVLGLALVTAGLGASVLSPLIPPLLRPVLCSLLLALVAVSMARVAPALVYPALIGAGIKILVADLRAGEAVVLVLSFSLYGAALLLAPRVMRRTPPA